MGRYPPLSAGPWQAQPPRSGLYTLRGAGVQGGLLSALLSALPSGSRPAPSALLRGRGCEAAAGMAVWIHLGRSVPARLLEGTR